MLKYCIVFCLLCLFSNNRIKGFTEICPSSDGTKILLENSFSSCIDGSKPSYYIRLAEDSRFSKWHIFFEGAGWSYELQTCIRKTAKPIGTSKYYPTCIPGSMMNFYELKGSSLIQPMKDWNSVLVKECDGSSFLDSYMSIAEVSSF